MGLGWVDPGEREAWPPETHLENLGPFRGGLHWGPPTRIEQPPAKALSRLKRAGLEYLKARDEESDSGHDHMV